MPGDRREAEVFRLLTRYLVEVVERWNLCPWARLARERDEVGMAVVWGETPTKDAWVTAAQQQLARPGVQVAMIVAPELGIDRIDLHDVRNGVSTAVEIAGVAEFHPDAEIDLASPARLVPFTRRSPDPLLQLVPLAILDSIRGTPPAIDRVDQIRMLGGHAKPMKRDAGDRIADANHATITDARAEVIATLDDIAADRVRSYAAAGITIRVGQGPRSR
ncbi:MAG TPA: DUF1415 family protein [Kofleriaceae bacterium]